MGRRFKQLLAEDRLIRVFCAGRFVNPITIDLFALAGGYDGFWLDQEHVGLNYQEVQLAAVAARANGLDCFVRMAPTNYAQVTQNLEAGAGGVMAARVETAAEAAEFVRWAKFAPFGMRGINTAGRDALYTHKKIAELAADANREHFVAVQIETVGALDDADAIAALEGVDLLFVGPADLSQSMGIIGQMAHDKIWEAIDHVADVCRQHGKHWGTVPADPKYAERCAEKGCRMLTMGNDVVAMRRGIEAERAAYQKLFPQA
jgi:4-hydroxy-2-oxoheptanedioate aldolase